RTPRLFSSRMIDCISSSSSDINCTPCLATVQSWQKAATVNRADLIEKGMQSLRLHFNNCIRDARNPDHFGHIVDADDVRATQNRCGYGSGGAEQAFLGRSTRTARSRNGLAEKRFSRCADHYGAAE